MQLDSPAVDPEEFSAFCLLGLSDYLEDVQRVDKHFRRCAALVVLIWLSLVSLTYAVVPEESLERMEGIEKIVPFFACIFFLLSMAGRLFTIRFLDQTRSFGLSGVLIGSITVQSMAFITNATMASGCLTPVMVDPIFGNRVHLLRWCEWTPLAFYLMFLTDGIDAPSPTGLRGAYKLGAAQGLSTFCGLLFPFTRGPVEWTVLMVVSCLLFLCLFPRLYSKSKRFRQMEPGVSSHNMELYDRARLSYQLMCTCTTAWSLLVFMYFVSGAGYYFAPAGSILKSEAFNMIWECTVDVISKNLCMNLIVQVHKVVFDDKERAERRLGEHRRLMSAVWESSSDVICVSVRGISGAVRTMVSPAYMRIYHAKPSRYESTKALLFDIDLEAVQKRTYSNVTARKVQSVDFNSLSELKSREYSDHRLDKGPPGIPTTELDDNLLSSMAGLIARAWNVNKDATSLTHKLLKAHGEEQLFTPCEANVCRLENDSMLVIVRDISERSQRFEAEKKMIFETTARKKDAEANRFTKHEVKNGLLAAIGLCESLKETANLVEPSPPQDAAREEGKSFQTVASVVSIGNNKSPATKPDVSRYTQELDKTLKDILDTILSEAMARDVIHGAYEPKLECVNINETLCTSNATGTKHEMFPTISDPSPLPYLYFDRQLLKYIHGNAISNACKYGQKGGVVTTMVYFDSTNEILKMDVINNPGDKHDHLVRLGEKANDVVFSPGTRLHGGGNDEDTLTHSAGDGAWIMRKCAETLKGKASISFEPNRTVFSFWCPATRFDEVQMTRSVYLKTFQLPPNTWGIAIDDSKIQRKLLGAFLTYAGVEEARKIVLGGTTREITGFADSVVELVGRHSLDYFLLIVDENIDIFEDSKSSMSGSKCIEKIRRRLPPDQERRVLGLVRSANDSSLDIAIYNSRAHGFICKAPIRKNAVLETLAPLWEKRFMHMPPAAGVDKSPGPKAGKKSDPVSDFACLVMIELQKNLDAIDELCSGEVDSLLVEKWPLIWEKLHCLKGDLLSSLNTLEIQKAVSDINSLRGARLPLNFLSGWTALRSQIASNINMENLSGGDISDENSSARSMNGEKRSSREVAVNGEPLQKKHRTNDVSETVATALSSPENCTSQDDVERRNGVNNTESRVKYTFNGDDGSDLQLAKRQRL